MKSSSAPGVLAIGGSAGAVEALITLVAALPEDYAVPVLVVLHIPPEAQSHLPEILSRSGSLPAQHAVNGVRIQSGRIYVAPPDHHLMVADGRLALSRGPRENGHRPAIDPLFRSVAQSFAHRAVAVVLSGGADDGSAGVLAVSRAGGTTVAQDPEDALHPSMPDSAIKTGAVKEVLDAQSIGPFLADIFLNSNELRREEPKADHALIAEGMQLPIDQARTRPSGFSCPECHGVLFEVDDPPLHRFRCRIGHAYSEKSLQAEQAKDVESVLWIAVRALEERAALLEKIARRLRGAGGAGGERSARRMDREAAELKVGADQIRALLQNRSLIPSEGVDPEPAESAAKL